LVKNGFKNNVSKDVEVNMFGQELNPQTYSICKSDFLITNEQPENIKLGSTLSKDGYQDTNRKFDYMICNPPYGVSWKKDQKFVIKESKRILTGRFSVGTPRVSDGQLLISSTYVIKNGT
jgi:type I restriction enzyme M protein